MLLNCMNNYKFFITKLKKILYIYRSTYFFKIIPGAFSVFPNNNFILNFVKHIGTNNLSVDRKKFLKAQNDQKLL